MQGGCPSRVPQPLLIPSCACPGAWPGTGLCPSGWAELEGPCEDVVPGARLGQPWEGWRVTVLAQRGAELC